MGRPHPPFPMPRLSSPFREMRDHYKAIVVGSGYGGGIAAARLARAGYSLCVLERGGELHPGEYPSSLGDAAGAFQLHVGDRTIGDETSLFDLRIGNGMSSLVGCGLGGTSLINANVCLEASPWVLKEAEWPAEIRNDQGGRLRGGIDRAEKMLTPSPYPQPPLALHKLRQLEREASVLIDGSGKFTQPPLAVSFKTAPNPVGIEQVACRECGDCVSGCNYGAKNTVLMNYLPYARKYGAEIFTEIHVDWLERRNGRWLVRFRRVGSGEDIYAGPYRWVSADIVVLAAGTFGSTEILLRSRKHCLPLSDRVGERFSANGDTTAFAYNCRERVNGIGLGEERPDDHDPVGPCITGAIDLRAGVPPEEEILIEEGSPPGAVARVLPIFLALMSVFGMTDPSGGRLRVKARDRVKARWRWLLSLPASPYKVGGAIQNTQTHLVMAHDSAGGKLRLSAKDCLRIEYPGAGNEPIYALIDKKLAKATDALDGVHIPNPLWDKLWNHSWRRLWHWLTRTYRRKKPGDRDLITVHPLGGCAMAADAGSGVVNHKHQVFSGRSGTEVHDSLYVCDGAVVPRSLGVNPLLTISGLAERACEYLLQERGDKLDDSLAAVPSRPFPPAPRPPRTLGLRFAERLAGWAHVQSAPEEATEKDYREAERDGKNADSKFDVVLDMEIDDLDHMIEDPEHMIQVTGIVRLPKLFSGTAMIGAGSWGQTLFRDPDRVNELMMRYCLYVTTQQGEKFRVEGEKHVRDHWGPFPLWRETTTLYTRVYDDQNLVCARGIIYVGFRDFLKQMVSQHLVRPASRVEHLAAWFRFNFGFFIGTLTQNAFRFLAPSNAVDHEAKRLVRTLTAPQPTVHAFKARDGVELRLTHYPGKQGPVILSHGLGVSSRIFSIDTIDTNLVEALCAEDYDVWLLDYRASIALREACFEQFNADDVAKNDYPAAVDEVLRLTKVRGAKDVQLVAHCYGSTTLFMSLLGGHLDPEKVRCVVVSQIATHLVTSVDSRVKAGVYAGNWLYWAGLPYLNAYTDTSARFRQRAWNFLLRFLPLHKDERCRSDVCHRISYAYSLLYEHKQLDSDTHDALHEMFGVANITALRHLAEMTRQGKLVDAHGEDVYIPHMGKRLRIPMLFIHGADNYCFKPESTKITVKLLEELQEGAPPSTRVRYERIEIPRYGHIDCIFGKNAASDVYPKITEYLDRY